MGVAGNLSQLVADGRCREVCLELPLPNFSGGDVILDERAAERLHQVYAFLSNGYLWEPGKEPTQQLPVHSLFLSSNFQHRSNVHRH
ncbi:MAG: hypothetical protein Ct9H300mP13_1330 [Gammaproteobacteria bacterium]|nr:MAG: hypothetical protein Ct9H300mP13_1330 [Gammaproteobacteria bacterium]